MMGSKSYGSLVKHVHRGTHETQLTHEMLVKLCHDGSEPTSKGYQVILREVHVVTSVSGLLRRGSSLPLACLRLAAEILLAFPQEVDFCRVRG
jgi:hypothetical protein